jgi:hypothetical protein
LLDICLCHGMHILPLLLLIMDIPVSNLGPEARYPVSLFSWFFSDIVRNIKLTLDLIN